MKKMLEELRNMNNEEEYEVPVNFGKKVINKIQKENHKNKAVSYIISSLSVAAVAFVAVVIATSNSMYKFNEDSDEYLGNEKDTLQYATSTYNTKTDDDKLMFKAIPEKEAYDLNKTSEIERLEIADVEEKYLNEIVDMLKINKMDVEILDDESVKVKAKKEDIELVLYYFDGEIDIVQDGEYCIIKEK